MYSCPGCGSQMTFDIAGQQLKCGRCERTMSIIEADGLEARQAGSSFSVDVHRCPTCGAECTDNFCSKFILIIICNQTAFSTVLFINEFTSV